MPQLAVYQDGPDFYAEGVGHIWSAPEGMVKHDHDMKGAEEARALFLAYANVEGIRVQFEHVS